jgi:hypothetical protein
VVESQRGVTAGWAEEALHPHTVWVSDDPDRWQRHDWWGVVLDTDDVEMLTRFYAELRGWRIHHVPSSCSGYEQFSDTP